MKIILTQPVAGVGDAGDVVVVKDGYARNYLVPRGLAMRWTRGAEREVTTIRRGKSERDLRDLGSAQAAKATLEATPVVVSAKAGAAGKLFGAITPADVVAAISAAGGPAIDRRSVELPQPIKTIGVHSVAVRLHPEVTATLAVEVSAG
jgi:large subunit ribosomal protein L9